MGILPPRVVAEVRALACELPAKRGSRTHPALTAAWDRARRSSSVSFTDAA